jgi:hypothetical protein
MVGLRFLTVDTSLTQRGQRVEVGGSTGWLVFGVDGFARDSWCLGAYVGVSGGCFWLKVSVFGGFRQFFRGFTKN